MSSLGRLRTNDQRDRTSAFPYQLSWLVGSSDYDLLLQKGFYLIDNAQFVG